MSALSKAAVALVCAGMGGSALAQNCEGQWLPGYGVPGVDGSVNAMTLWDPDGNGPQPQLLIIGGSFSIVDKTPAPNIAAWDGQSWSALGTGVNGAVKALAVYQGKLCVAGTFTQAGGAASGPLATWDGATWQSAGTEPTAINALQVFQGELVVAGNLTLVGAGTSIAKWNGTAWSFLGPGSTIRSGINALAVYQNKLIAAGSFSSAGGQPAGGIAAWDGAWTPLGTGIGTTKSINALGVYGDQLFAGGDFTSIGGVSSVFLARWTGSEWEPSGAPFTTFGLSNPGVRAIAIFEGKLIAGGNTFPERLFSWDGSSWSTVGPRIESPVFSLQPFGDALFAGTDGSYRSASGRGLSVLRNAAWQAIAEGFSEAFVAAAEFENRLVIGGGFAHVPGADARLVASWDGATWRSMKGEQLAGVRSLRVQANDLYVGTSTATPFSVGNYVSKWDGGAWAPLSQQINPVSSGGANAFFLGEYQGQLLALGSFVAAGPVTLNGIGLWNGIAWQPIGNGLSLYGESSVAYQGELIVAGSRLYLPPNTGSGCILRYDGVEWKLLLPNLRASTAVPMSLLVYQNKLVVSGSDLAIGGTTYGSIGAWDGASFGFLNGVVNSAVGGSVYSTVEYHGSLVAVGSFSQTALVSAKNVARWNGTAWAALGAGLNGSALKATVWRNELIVGGSFTTAGGLPSANFARWTDNPTPWVAVSPESKPVNEGLTLTLNAAAASGYVNVSYQWKRNGVAISDGSGGASAGGGTVSGASGTLASPSDGASVMLTIAGVQASDAGDYTIEFDNTCNAATSSIATVSVNTCPGDLNDDGFVNDTDFGIFSTAYDILMCDAASMPIGCLSDWNGDGVVDDADFQLFVVAYVAMVCE